MARWFPGRRRRAVREERVEAVPAPPPARPFWPWLLLLLALVIAALAASWYFATRDETVEANEIPRVEGLRREEAEERLRARNFQVEIERVVSSRDVGTVVEQRPKAGTLYGERGIVVLSIARDPTSTEVPDVRGLPVARALRRLRAAELRPRAQEVASREPRGTVLRQLPGPGEEVPTNSPALVVVSRGQQIVSVPDVIGLTAEQATQRLTRAGFRTRVDRVPGTEPEGTVIAQAPTGASRAARASVVRVNVSMGPGTTGRRTTTTTVVTTTATTAETEATVPNTVGEDEATARATLEGAGFRVRVADRVTTDPAREGIVVAQRPAGGSTARPGSTVTIFVGRLQ